MLVRLRYSSDSDTNKKKVKVDMKVNNKMPLCQMRVLNVTRTQTLAVVAAAARLDGGAAAALILTAAGK